jgi:hypothetical protein
MARAAPPSSVRLRSKQSTGHHGCQRWSAQILPTKCETKQQLFLRDLEEKGIPFYSLSAEETIHGDLAVVAWRSQTSTASHNLIRASLAPRNSHKASPWSPQASPWFNCFKRQWIEIVRRLSSCTRVFSCGSKFGRIGYYFWAFFASDRSACGVITDYTLRLIQNRVR